MRTKFLSLFLCFIVVLGSVGIAYADVSPYVSAYKLMDAGNAQLSLMRAGDKGKLELSITDSGLNTGDITNKDSIEVISVSGCFGDSAAVSKKEITSQTGNLSYKLTFDNIVYTGSGSHFSFKIRYKSLNRTSQLINLKISECSPAGESGDTYTETDENGDTAVTVLAPAVEIVRSNIAPVKGGETFETELTVKNHGSVTMLKPVISISTAGSISLAENTSSLFIPDIKAGAKAKVKLKFKAEEKISNSSDEFLVNIKYNYNSGAGGISSNVESAVITVPMAADTTGESTPAVRIVRGDIKPVAAGSSFVLPITIENMGETDISNAVLNITTDEELFVTDGNITHYIEKLPAKSKKTVNIGLEADKMLTESYRGISCELAYNYMRDKEVQNGTETVKLVIPMISNAQQGAAPLVQITKSDIRTAVAANKTFTFTLTVKNVGTTDIVNSVLNIDGGDEIVLLDGTSSFSFTSLKAGESRTFKIKAKTAAELTSSSQSINAELKYNYLSGKNYESASESTKLIVPAVKTKTDDEIKSSTPNVIIESFYYGGGSVANGERFDLEIVFKNMGSRPVENLVLALSPENSLAISSSANTYYYKSLGAGASQRCSVEMYALPTAESGSAKVNISFRYEYTDDKSRNEASSEQSVSVPLYKPDFMEIIPGSTDAAGIVGEEYSVSLDYVNKGKGEISNVRAELTGDVDCEQKIQNLGNFEAGKSGKINFIVTPLNVGENQVSIRLTYEDANMKEKERFFNFSINAEDAVYDEFDEYTDEMPEEEKGGGHKVLFIGGGIAAAAAAAVIFIKRRKRKKDLIKINWED